MGTLGQFITIHAKPRLVFQVTATEIFSFGLKDSGHFSLSPAQIQSDEPISPLFIDFFDISRQSIAEALSPIGQLDDTGIDHLLRAYAKTASRAHYASRNHTQSKVAIPPSGKVLGPEELDMMIESSLDMWLTAGRFSDEFEVEFAKFLGVKYALAVNSGSSANLLAMTALTSPKLKDRQLKPGDEVISVAAGFPATIAPIIQNQLVPVFVDVDIPTYNINIAQLEASITPKTKAILIAHTLGNPFNLDAVMAISKKYNLWVIEDNCDALGAEYNGQKTATFGHLSTVSFYPAHHMTMGEGGAVMTQDRELYKIVMSYRDWGRDCWCAPGCDNTCQNRFGWALGSLPKGYDHKYIYSHMGYNLKITDWQAAIGLAQLKKLPQFIQKRRDNFAKLTTLLTPYTDHLILPQATPNSLPSWFGYLITVSPNSNVTRDDIVRHLDQQKVGTRPLFAGNMLRHPATLTSHFPMRLLDGELMISSSLTEADFAKLPNTETILNSSFWVGIWPGLTDEDLSRIASEIGVALTTSVTV